jgi:hypothetical protein
VNDQTSAGSSAGQAPDSPPPAHIHGPGCFMGAHELTISSMRRDGSDLFDVGVSIAGADVPLTPEEATDLASRIIDAAARAEYDCAVFNQIREHPAVNDRYPAGQAVKALRAQQPHGFQVASGEPVAGFAVQSLVKHGERSRGVARVGLLYQNRRVLQMPPGDAYHIASTILECRYHRERPPR